VRPVGMIAMSRKVAPGVLPEDVLNRLSRALHLHRTEPVESFDDAEARECLATVEVLLTSWSCPRIDARVLDAAPRLRAVVHAAGSVKGHVGPEVFARGITVSSAADANADPVADFTVAVITVAENAASVSRKPMRGAGSRRSTSAGATTAGSSASSAPPASAGASSPA